MRFLLMALAVTTIGGALALSPAMLLVLLSNQGGAGGNMLILSAVTAFWTLGLLLLVEWKTRSRRARALVPLALLLGIWGVGLIGLLTSGARELAQGGSADLVHLSPVARVITAVGLAAYLSLFGVMFLTLVLPLVGVMEWSSRRYDRVNLKGSGSVNP